MLPPTSNESTNHTNPGIIQCSTNETGWLLILLLTESTDLKYNHKLFRIEFFVNIIILSCATPNKTTTFKLLLVQEFQHHNNNNNNNNNKYNIKQANYK